MLYIIFLEKLLFLEKSGFFLRIYTIRKIKEFMKNVLIIEHNQNSLKPINESNGVQADKYTLGGTFTEFDVKNRNERIYTWDKFKPALDELNERIQTAYVYGEFDHPSDFDISLKNASHLITDVSYNIKENKVDGVIKLLDLNYGKEAKSLVDSGAPIFVSSRAAGITEANGEVTLKKLFTYDLVADPGFASARMQSLNESIGYSPNSDFQIYEMEDESKINKLFEMNKNDMVTKKQMVDYSEYLVDIIKETKLKINESIKQGKIEPKKLDELFEYYENMMQEQSKISQYLDYLAEKIQVVVTENQSLKESNSKLEKTTNNLIKHNDYLAENLEKSIEFSDYIAENVDKSIQYGEYIAEQVDKSIQYGEYIAENLDKTIQFGDYLSENLNKSIEYSEYIAENVDSNIAYSEYIAENLDDNIAYNDYIAEQLDKSIGYTKMISEKLNESTGKLFENATEEEILFPSPDMAGIEEVEDDEELVNYDDDSMELDTEVDIDVDAEDDANCRVVCDDDEENLEDTPELGDVDSEIDVTIDGNEDEDGEFEVTANEDEELEESLEESVNTDECETEDCEEDTDTDTEENEEENEEIVEENLTKSIDKLIEEAKKREAFETTEHHFLKFLNKDQNDAFYGLSQDDQESVVAHINEKDNYYTSTDVLSLMNEALKSKEETLEESLVRLMPESVKETWGNINESAKGSILNQARLHNTNQWNENTIEHFWLTRRFPVIKESNRELLAHEDKLIQEDNLTDDVFNSIMERFNKV